MSSLAKFQDQTGTTELGVALGAPRVLLRAEGLVVLCAAVVLFYHLGASWMLFGLLFFAPDLFMIGYLRNARLGALVYNIGHTYCAPAVAIGVASLGHSTATIAVGLIWVAHIGFDRLVGYGLKYSDAFHHTHLGSPFHRTIG